MNYTVVPPVPSSNRPEAPESMLSQAGKAALRVHEDPKNTGMLAQNEVAGTPDVKPNTQTGAGHLAGLQGAGDLSALFSAAIRSGEVSK